MQKYFMITKGEDHYVVVPGDQFDFADGRLRVFLGSTITANVTAWDSLGPVTIPETVASDAPAPADVPAAQPDEPLFAALAQSAALSDPTDVRSIHAPVAADEAGAA